jgi:hypothetical protein
MERLAHKMDLVNQQNDENSKRLNNELKALREIIRSNSDSIRQSTADRESLKDQLNNLNNDLKKEKAYSVRSAADFSKRLADQKSSFDSDLEVLRRKHASELSSINKRLVRLEKSETTPKPLPSHDVTNHSTRVPNVAEQSSKPTFAEATSKPTNSNNKIMTLPTSKNAMMNYKKLYAIILHDGTHRNFDQSNFDTKFRLETYETKGLMGLKKDNGGLAKLIKKVNPDCIYVHLGMNDLLEKRDDKTISTHYYDLAEHLLASYRANVCFSLIIPTHNNEMLKARIKSVNNDVIDMVSYLRSTKHEFRNRLFTFENNRIGDHSTYIQGSQQFSTRGKKMIWMRLNEGLKKTLRLPRPSYSDKPLKNTGSKSSNINKHGDV